MVLPEADTYVSGVTTLKAEILPRMLATRVAQILFFADGKQVCNVLDPLKAECTWDAGAEVRPHVFRVVGNLIGGGRIISSSRTKGLDQVETVNVEVVQITAVVTDRGRFVGGLAQSQFRLLIALQPFRLLKSGFKGVKGQLVVAKRANSLHGFHHGLVAERREMFRVNLLEA